ncbi:FkbM family methyltransferase [Bradyrhizobium japonicum]|uniref:FkbM family methyltransferase n=1 Tax=Bradyrhizobium japonicum TaxID=375 RepID=UPI0004625938|nr:FkbM family methyltransferase [Bradyrhizobium japonicum]
MSFFRRLQINLDDVRRYGPQFLKRHLPRITGADTAVIRAGSQAIHVRAGESDTAAIRGVFGARQYELGLPELKRRVNDRYDAIIRSGEVPVIVDAGANIGAASLWFKANYPRSAVVAVEPEPGNFGVLSRNASLAQSIFPIQAAIGSEPGFVTIQAGDLGWATRVERASTGLPIITMQQAFASVPRGTPFIAKIDIEGFEQELFSKNTEWLADLAVVHIEPHDWMVPGKGTSLSFQKAIANFDFELFLAGEVLTYVRHGSFD